MKHRIVTTCGRTGGPRRPPPHHKLGGGSTSRITLPTSPDLSSCDDNRRSSALLTALIQLEDAQRTETDDSTYAALLRWCGNEKALVYGRRVHAYITTSGRDQNTFLANLLVQMYGKCGSVQDARRVFNAVRQRDTFSWNFMIAAYAQNGHEPEALQLYTHMQMDGVKTNKFTFFPILSASGSLRALSEGKQIHERIVAYGFDSDINLRSALVTMYGKCGSLKDARVVFDQTHERDTISWNAMIAAYAQNGYGKEALDLFTKMELEGVKPDRNSFLSILDACANLASLKNGKAMHERIDARGFQSDLAVNNALVNMYGKSGSLKDARAVFDQMHARNVISWTAMIAAYVQNGYSMEALELFGQMDLEGVKPDRVTFLSVLDACATLPSLENGRLIHERIIAGRFELDLPMRTSLLNMYGKCGSLKDARAVFDHIHERDLISWNAMIAAYAQNGHSQEAVNLFKQMDLEGIKPDRFTFLSVLDACASLLSLEFGRAIHGHIVSCGLESDVSLRNALINMYGKCGVFKDAQVVFDGMHERNVISWTALIAAYAQTGHGQHALGMFSQMDLEGVKPNAITFVSILNACSHAGLHDAGRRYFTSLEGDYNITPCDEHYRCMCDLLGRVGCLDEAEDLIINMPVDPKAVAWISLLGACRIHGDVERGARAAENVLLLDPEDPSSYISLSNIYAAAGRSNDAANMRRAII